MQEDFNSGDSFISFVITPVSLCLQKGKEDNNLRYFEEKAISMFNSCFPDVGYNSNGTCSQLCEILNIMDTKKFLEKSDFKSLENTEGRF